MKVNMAGRRRPWNALAVLLAAALLTIAGCDGCKPDGAWFSGRGTYACREGMDDCPKGTLCQDGTCRASSAVAATVSSSGERPSSRASSQPGSGATSVGSSSSSGGAASSRVGVPDAGRPDAGRPDAGRPDAGRPDAGRPDAGPRQSGVLGQPCASDADCRGHALARCQLTPDTRVGFCAPPCIPSPLTCGDFGDAGVPERRCAMTLADAGNGACTVACRLGAHTTTPCGRSGQTCPCDAGLVCVEQEVYGGGSCLPPAAVPTCGEGCDGGLVCAPQHAANAGTCGAECSSNDMCTGDRTHGCYEWMDGGVCAPSWLNDVGETCIYPWDCRPGLRCSRLTDQFGICGAPCGANTTLRCPEGNLCVDHQLGGGAICLAMCNVVTGVGCYAAFPCVPFAADGRGYCITRFAQRVEPCVSSAQCGLRELCDGTPENPGPCRNVCDTDFFCPGGPCELADAGYQWGYCP